MAQDATELYHLHVTDESHLSESVVNRAVNSGVTEPFYPTGLEQPETDGQRAQLLEDVDPVEGEKVPIILSTAGMLHAGHAPRYLSELVSRFHDYRLCLTGYQAVGTPGRAVQNATEAGADTVSLELDTTPFEASWQTTPDVQPIETGSSGQTARVIVDTDKVETYSGFSGHAAQHGLLDFVRAVEPNTTALIHGEPFAQRGLAEHIASNVDAVEQVTSTRLLTPIPVTRDPELATVTIETADTDRDIYDIAERLQQQVTELSREVANLRQQSVSKTDVEKMIEKSDKTPSE
jgi:metallo-beta-lactamase family protein